MRPLIYMSLYNVGGAGQPLARVLAPIVAMRNSNLVPL